MMVALSVIAVLALAITTGLGIYVVGRPQHVVPEKDEVKWPDHSWTLE